MQTSLACRTIYTLNPKPYIDPKTRTDPKLYVQCRPLIKSPKKASTERASLGPIALARKPHESTLQSYTGLEAEIHSYVNHKGMTV